MTSVVLVSCDSVLAECLKADLESTRFELKPVMELDQLDEHLEKLKPKAVLIPVELPGCDTISLATQMRRSTGAGRPAVVMLGLDEDQRAAARKASGAAYLEIPFGRSELVEILERVTRKSKLVVLADDETRRALDKAALADLAQELAVQLELGETLERGTGVVIVTADGHRRYDNTLETRLERMQATLRAPVYHILMGETP